MTNTLLGIIVLQLTYLIWGKLKKEEKVRSVINKVAPVKTKVLEYIPPEDEEVRTSRELTEEITKQL
jgi:hypothetical protein